MRIFLMFSGSISGSVAVSISVPPAGAADKNGLRVLYRSAVYSGMFSFILMAQTLFSGAVDKYAVAAGEIVVACFLHEGGVRSGVSPVLWRNRRDTHPEMQNGGKIPPSAVRTRHHRSGNP